MAEQARDAGEFHGYLTVTVPLSTLRRLRPYSTRRQRSEFVRQAIAAALDKADQDQGQDRAPEPAGAER
jgi:hypothetical protein